METKIFTSHPVMQNTLQTAVQRATIEASQDFEAKLTKAVYGMGQGSSTRDMSRYCGEPTRLCQQLYSPITYTLIQY
eukprot:7830642-Karenia_brevis.AAC.1